MRLLMRLAIRVLVALLALGVQPVPPPRPACRASRRLRSPRNNGRGGGPFRPTHAGLTSPALSARAACSGVARAGFFRTNAGTAG